MNELIDFKEWYTVNNIESQFDIDDLESCSRCNTTIVIFGETYPLLSGASYSEMDAYISRFFTKMDWIKKS